MKRSSVILLVKFAACNMKFDGIKCHILALSKVTEFGLLTNSWDKAPDTYICHQEVTHADFDSTFPVHKVS